VSFPTSRQSSDEEFAHKVYNILLGRDPDPVGLAGVVSELASGTPSQEIFRRFVHSPEFEARFAGYTKPPRPLPNLIARRPERYFRSGEFLCFNAAQSDDFDWLERCILDYGFYERPGPWGYGVNVDKTVLASMIASLGLSGMFELGCGDGSVIACAERLGVKGAGLDISAHAKSLARPGVQEKIVLGDLLEIEGLPKVELICAFDLIEHISPNKIDKLLSKIRSLLERGGVAIFNTPAFGDDRIYGLVHSYWIEEWRGENRRGQLWRDFPCDEMGFPLMGHLIWADSVWWEKLFERHGFSRLDAVERKLHAKFDATMEYSIARKSYFVLGNDVDDARAQRLCRAVEGFDLERALAACHDLIAH
jgi:hypothetical protein